MQKISDNLLLVKGLLLSLFIADLKLTFFIIVIKMATYEEKLIKAQSELEELEAQKKIVLTAQQWETRDGQASRSVVNISFRELLKAIEYKKREIERLENLITGNDKSIFRVGVRF